MPHKSRKAGKPLPSFRWRAEISYRHSDGLNHAPRQVFLEELFQLHDVVEQGPHWDTIEGIQIARINHNESPTLTVEQAEQL